MADQHGVASTRPVTGAGRRPGGSSGGCVADGVLVEPCPGRAAAGRGAVDVPRPGHGRRPRRPASSPSPTAPPPGCTGSTASSGHDVVDVIAARGADPAPAGRRDRPPHPRATIAEHVVAVEGDPGAVDRRHAGAPRPGRRRPGHGPGARQRHPPRRRSRRAAPHRRGLAPPRPGRPRRPAHAPRPPRHRPPQVLRSSRSR